MSAMETAACLRIVVEPRSPLADLPDSVPAVVLLDLSACPEPDSHLVTRLTVFGRQLTRRGAKVHFVGASPALRAVIRLLGVDRALLDHVA